ncbi:hypothetical protein GGTG_11587 [Gaeumannomyces tritici R3-111a-1]|uniref:Uncharacterized protein n=1 Tax=Gaeumannomyces tritici (strain R3-111a-1) TaxID=644352 RepID=J3PDL4_GAET3|nr:hypothetical protein GGTG_11587 [Gaeumannomyces tritici R3-111a-1]EJT70564.1 hypothetical protein GGTG_11587 [Gaeumannomyces tritici R3-111a-1]
MCIESGTHLDLAAMSCLDRIVRRSRDQHYESAQPQPTVPCTSRANKRLGTLILGSANLCTACRRPAASDPTPPPGCRIAAGGAHGGSNSKKPGGGCAGADRYQATGWPHVPVVGWRRGPGVGSKKLSHDAWPNGPASGRLPRAFRFLRPSCSSSVGSASKLGIERSVKQKRHYSGSLATAHNARASDRDGTAAPTWNGRLLSSGGNTPHLVHGLGRKPSGVGGRASFWDYDVQSFALLSR